MSDIEPALIADTVRPLWPFFSYFGGKWRSAPRYPIPTHNRLVEPFAGSAGYAVRHHQHAVELYDADPVIIGLWQYLIGVSPEEIRRLPLTVRHVDDLTACEEAKWLIGFWLNKGTATPHLSPSAWMRSEIRPNSYWGEVIRERIASQVDAIRHWKATCLSYKEIGDMDAATWFVDPPYDHESGRRYRAKVTDYVHLADWCRALDGQVMVCERDGADWLPFEPFHVTKATPGRHGKGHSAEVLWVPHIDGYETS